MNTRKILIIDNDVMVHIFDELFKQSKYDCEKVIQHLSLEYAEIWIPSFVKNEEFLHKNHRKRRIRFLDKITKRFQLIRDCPITVSQSEIDFLQTTGNGIDKGEADAIIQARKAKGNANQAIRFSQICLLMKDKRAIQGAKSFLIDVYEYLKLVETMRLLNIFLRT